MALVMAVPFFFSLKNGGTNLRTNLEVILLIIPVDVPLLACAKAPVSCDGEAGGPL